MLYTWGYKGGTSDRLLKLARALQVDAVYDCRSVPRTRVPGFGTRQLAALLGPLYSWQGQGLGGLCSKPSGGPNKSASGSEGGGCPEGVGLLLVTPRALEHSLLE